MPAYDYLILVAAWIVWSLPFFVLMQKKTSTAAKVDRRARWGMLIQGIAYALLWQGAFWVATPAAWRVALSLVFFILGIALCWSATKALGRQWRFDAGLNADHDLVRSGAYRLVRHPIYTSMLCMLLGTGFMITPWPLFAAAIAVFLVGTEIRVRIEDSLLASRFGDEFERYRRSVSAYLPTTIAAAGPREKSR
jgi:protein-S-isoprenylcysteine O-methyltransferase Ste14